MSEQNGGSGAPQAAPANSRQALLLRQRELEQALAAQAAPKVPLFSYKERKLQAELRQRRAASA